VAVADENAVDGSGTAEAGVRQKGERQEGDWQKGERQKDVDEDPEKVAVASASGQSFLAAAWTASLWLGIRFWWELRRSKSNDPSPLVER
jgi:hypothetical protein